MKIAITHPYSWPEVRRGAERIVVETSRALAGRGHDVTVLTSGSTPGCSSEDEVRTLKVKRRFEDAERHERYFAARIAPYFIGGRFDVVHAMMPWDAYVAMRLRRLCGHRVVVDEMGIPYKGYWSNQPTGRIRRRLIRRVDVYGCMSQYALDVLEADWGRVGALIPGGVRLSEFSVSEEREPAPTILFSGALTEPRKGVALLLEAVALLASDLPDVQLWLSGPGDPGPMIAASPPAAQSRVQVLPLGSPEEQGNRYRRAWATALPSVADSFGLVLIESLASGTPIVVLDDAAPPSLVTATTGAIAAPNDPGSLAAALGRALDLARSPGTAAECRRFASRFDWDHEIAPLLEKLYRPAGGTCAAGK